MEGFRCLWVACILASCNIYNVCGFLTGLSTQCSIQQQVCCSTIPCYERKETLSESCSSSRRDLFVSFGLAVTFLLPDETRAVPQQKPFAPTEALLPILKLQLWFEDAYVVSTSMEQLEPKQREELYALLLQMNDILSNPPKLLGEREKMAKASMSANFGQLTGSISSANKNQYQSNRQSLNVANKVAAMLNQADVERQWGMLQYAEQKRANENEMRAAFNFYTSQLSFGDSYVLTANKEDRKTMIRNDELPTLTAVITSDLDLRDLYRNQFLTAIEDLKAEVAYQIKLGGTNEKEESIDEMNITDVLGFMDSAHTAMENWFALIDDKEIEDAKKSLLQ